MRMIWVKRIALGIAVAALTCTAVFFAFRDRLDPRLTEVWQPPVPMVAPPPPMPFPPPPEAVVLIGERGLGAWQTMDGGPARWAVSGDIVTVDKAAGNIRTRRKFGDYTLHLEWRTPPGITGEGQWRGNSGLFLGATGDGDEGYELQILDSYRNPTYVNGQAGAVYKQFAPLANPMRPPGEWNVYDVAWTAPRFAADGALASPARLTAHLNGILVQDNVALMGRTVFIGQPSYASHGRLPVMLQAHRDPSAPIAFRNVWLVEKR